jgi:hypothetical protein
VPDVYGSTVAKRRLSRILAERRQAGGYTANQVTDILSWGRGKVGRFEANQWKRPDLSALRDLMRLYEVPDATCAELEELARRARQRSWWRDYEDVYGENVEYPGFEADATRISVYMPLILPGLLQTAPYIEAHMRMGDRPPEWRRRAMEAMLRRQNVLARDDGSAPELVAVITEASLMYVWGTPEERRAQIEHLIDVGGRPGVELRLLRFAGGPHPGMSSLISIFDFPGDEPRMVYLENDTLLREVGTTEESDAYADLFRRIREGALPAPATTAYLKRLAELVD